MKRAALLALGLLAACAGSQAAPPAPIEPITALYPEGPLYDGASLYYAEMGADRVSVVEDGARRTFFTARGCGPTALAPYGAGFLILCHIGGRVVAVDRIGRELRSWDRDNAGALLRDPNDASADGQGGVYFSDPGVFSRTIAAEGRVMHLSAAGELRAISGVLWYPNGVFVDRARHTLLVSEHMEGRVLSYAIGADGALGQPRVYLDVMGAPRAARYASAYAETGPDGLEIGPDGDLFVSVYGEGRILRFSPAGQLVGMIELPTRFSTNIAFGPDGQAATTGTFNNTAPPYPGEVRFHTRESLTRAPH